MFFRVEFVLVLLAAAAFTGGCRGGEVAQRDPSREAKASPSPFRVSSEECSEAIRSLVENPRFHAFLAEYRAGTRRGVPRILCGRVVNRTDDVDLAPALLFKTLPKMINETGEAAAGWKISDFPADPNDRSVKTFHAPDFILDLCISQFLCSEKSAVFLRRVFTFVLIDPEGVVAWNFVKYVDVPMSGRIRRNVFPANEFETVCLSAVRSLLTDGDVIAFVRSHQRNAHGKSPVVKLMLKNDTTDPDFPNFFIWILQDKLSNSGRLRVSALEGQSRFADVMIFDQLAEDPHVRDGKKAFRPAAALILAVRVDEKKTQSRTTRDYQFSLCDAKTGAVICFFVKKMGVGDSRAH